MLFRAQLTSGFNISEDNVSTGGPSNIMKIYHATKKSNDSEISLFILEKNTLDKESPVIQDAVFEAIRKEVRTLAKLRHPSVLHIMEQLEEDSKLMCFATEPIEGSLKYIINHPSKHSIIPSELELKTQILELIEAINFLHNNAHLVHLAICPENIYVTSEGKFKIGGLHFSKELITPESTVAPNLDYALSSSMISLAPPLPFTAPEIIKNSIAYTSSEIGREHV